MPVRLGSRVADELWWSKTRRDGSVYDTRLHSSLIWRQLYGGEHHVRLEERAKHTLKKQEAEKVYMEKGGHF